MNSEKLKEVLELYTEWRRHEWGGVRANLEGADLEGADLRGACGAAASRPADLRWVIFREAKLDKKSLMHCILQGINITGVLLVG